MTDSISARGGTSHPGLPASFKPSKARPNRYAVTIKSGIDATATLFTGSYLVAGTTSADTEPSTYADLTVGEEDTPTNFIPVLVLNMLRGTLLTGNTRSLDFSALTVGKKVWLAWISLGGSAPASGDPVAAVCNLGTLGA